jgi:hypothetical protein
MASLASWNLRSALLASSLPLASVWSIARSTLSATEGRKNVFVVAKKGLARYGMAKD